MLRTEATARTSGASAAREHRPIREATRPRTARENDGALVVRESALLLVALAIGVAVAGTPASARADTRTRICIVPDQFCIQGTWNCSGGQCSLGSATNKVEAKLQLPGIPGIPSDGLVLANAYFTVSVSTTSIASSAMRGSAELPSSLFGTATAGMFPNGTLPSAEMNIGTSASISDVAIGGTTFATTAGHFYLHFTLNTAISLSFGPRTTVSIGNGSESQFLLDVDPTVTSGAVRPPAIWMSANLSSITAGLVGDSRFGFFPSGGLTLQIPSDARDVAGFRQDFYSTTRVHQSITPNVVIRLTGGSPIPAVPIEATGDLYLGIDDLDFGGALIGRLSLERFGVGLSVDLARTDFFIDGNRAGCANGAWYFRRQEGAGDVVSDVFAGTPLKDTFGISLPQQSIDGYICSDSDWLVEVSASAGTIAGISVAAGKFAFGPHGIRFLGSREVLGTRIEFEGILDLESGNTYWASTSALGFAGTSIANGTVSLDTHGMPTDADFRATGRIRGRVGFGDAEFLLDRSFSATAPPSSITLNQGFSAGVTVLGVPISVSAGVNLTLSRTPSCTVSGQASAGELSVGIRGSYAPDGTMSVSTTGSLPGIPTGTLFRIPAPSFESAPAGDVVSATVPAPPIAPAATHVPLPLAAGISAISANYESPTLSIQGDVVTLSGVARRSGTTWPAAAAVLPESARPRKILLFAAQGDGRALRVYVHPDGRVQPYPLDSPSSWVSLDGISFRIGQSGEPLALASGYGPYDARYDPPTVSGDGSIVRLQGTVQRTGSSWGTFATLPARHRPAGIVSFDALSGETKVRIDVKPDGTIQWVADASIGGDAWLSLSGIEFYRHGTGTETTRNAVPFAVASGVTSYQGPSYRSPSVQKSGGVVRLSGWVRRSGATWGLVGRLPTSHRPAKKRVFLLTTYDGTARVEVEPDGSVRVLSGGTGYAMISLANVRFFADGPDQPRTTPLVLASGVEPHPSYLVPSYVVRGDTVYLTGVARRGSTCGVLATLPESVRPRGRLVFGASQVSQQARVDVLTDGTVRCVSGAGSVDWVSLDGISYIRAGGSAPTFASGISDYGAEYEGVSVSREGPVVRLQGLAKRTASTSWGALLTLPTSMRPTQPLVFDAVQGRDSARINVGIDGVVTTVTGTGDNDSVWITLSGIEFVPDLTALMAGAETAPLALEASAVSVYGGNFRPPVAILVNDVVYLSGLVRRYGTGDCNLGHVPDAWAAPGRFIFEVNSHANETRVNMYPNGLVKIDFKESAYDFLSLDGIRFVLP